METFRNNLFFFKLDVWKKYDSKDWLWNNFCFLKNIHPCDNSDGRVTQEEFIKACLNQETISKMLALKVIDVFVGKE